jgi:antitoxin (DNA-binding transcriptional repressor) of toxin-antitoxin stability system
MTRVELTGATAPLADYARRARRGPVVLTRRGRPVALLRVLTDEEREDLAVATHPGFVDLIARSRRECPAGAGIALKEVAKQLAAKGAGGALATRRSSRRRGR